MSVVQDLRIIRRMVLGSRPRGHDHPQRMENFYAGQAEDYDAFRKRLLPGRAELLADLELPDQAVVADFGGGTGANLEFLPNSVHQRIREWTVVDLSPSLLAIAGRRTDKVGWQHVKLAQADACTWTPAQPVDLVLFSYSLTMIPEWQTALKNAASMLKPGGQIAVVDFTVAHRNTAPGIEPNSTFTRFFWPRWFAWDGVYLNPEHLPTLMTMFEAHSIKQLFTRLPYLPGSRVPYFRFIGTKRP